MISSYLQIAKLDPDGTGGLTIGYPTGQHAVAAAEVILHQWESISIRGPDGSLCCS